MSISPWDPYVRSESPDRQYVAVFDNSVEIAMGAPMRGTLTVKQVGHEKPVTELQDASGSFVWSSDSTMLAFPRWTAKRDQKLCILSLPSGRIEEMVGRFDVLQLESLCGGRLVGVDSPIYRPKNVEIQLPPSTKK